MEQHNEIGYILLTLVFLYIANAIISAFVVDVNSNDKYNIILGRKNKYTLKEPIFKIKNVFHESTAAPTISLTYCVYEVQLLGLNKGFFQSFIPFFIHFFVKSYKYVEIERYLEVYDIPFKSYKEFSKTALDEIKKNYAERLEKRKLNEELIVTEYDAKKRINEEYVINVNKTFTKKSIEY